MCKYNAEFHPIFKKKINIFFTNTAKVDKVVATFRIQTELISITVLVEFFYESKKANVFHLKSLFILSKINNVLKYKNKNFCFSLIVSIGQIKICSPIFEKSVKVT